MVPTRQCVRKNYGEGAEFTGQKMLIGTNFLVVRTVVPQYVDPDALVPWKNINFSDDQP